MRRVEKAKALQLFLETGQAGVEAQWWPLEAGDYAQVVGGVAVCCRYADLAVFGQHDPADARVPEDLVEQVLLGSGRPLLVVPWAGHFPDVGKRVAEIALRMAASAK